MPSLLTPYPALESSRKRKTPEANDLPYPLGLTYPTISMILSHTIHHEFSLPSHKEEQKNCHWCHFNKWSSHDLYPVSIVNQIPGNRDTLDVDFKFIEQNILGEGVELAGQDFQTGCDCDDSEGCLDKECECLDEIDTEGKLPGAKINAYHVKGDRKDCLRGEMLRSRFPIYECNERCGCGDDCANKVVSRGRKVPLQVFKTENRGWGMLSSHRSGIYD